MVLLLEHQTWDGLSNYSQGLEYIVHYIHLEKPKPYILHYCTQYNKFTLMDQKNTLWCTIL